MYYLRKSSFTFKLDKGIIMWMSRILKILIHVHLVPYNMYNAYCDIHQTSSKYKS